MTHPYRGKPREQFWSTISELAADDDFDPTSVPRFKFPETAPIAVIGSCFAQRLGRYLDTHNLRLYRTEGSTAEETNYLSAKYGNIYTPRQLRQLFLRAYSVLTPKDNVWRSADGSYIDPFRPQIPDAGAATKSAVRSKQAEHLLAVRRLFEGCQLLVLTLGLTEAWIADDESVVPLPPGAISAKRTSSAYRFHNFRIMEMLDDLSTFINDLRSVNPSVKLVITVSPVPIAATFLQRNVTISNMYTKSALRVLAEEMRNSFDFVEYFPSFEIVCTPHSKYRYFDKDSRTITERGICQVLKTFRKRYFLSSNETAPATEIVEDYSATEDRPYNPSYLKKSSEICDEELLDAETKVSRGRL